MVPGSLPSGPLLQIGRARLAGAVRLLVDCAPQPVTECVKWLGVQRRHRVRARHSEGGGQDQSSCCWAPSCPDHHSPPTPGDECATTINRRAAVGVVLRDMRHTATFTAPGNELRGVIVLVDPDCAARVGPLRQRCPLSPARRSAPRPFRCGCSKASCAGGLNRSTQHFILNGKDGVYGDESRISSRFHCGREGGVVGSLAARGVAESDWASVW